MSDEDPMVGDVRLSTLKVTELKEELEKHGLATNGKKAALQSRLKDFLTSDHSGAGDAEENAPKEKAVNPMVKEYLEKQAHLLKESISNDPRRKSGPDADEQVSSTKETNDDEDNENCEAEPSNAEKGDNMESEDSQNDDNGELSQKNDQNGENGSQEKESIESQERNDSIDQNNKEDVDSKSNENDVKPVISKKGEAVNEGNNESKNTEGEELEQKNVVLINNDKETGKLKENASNILNKDNDQDELDYGEEDEKEVKEEIMDTNEEATETSEKGRDVRKEEKVQGEKLHSRRASSPSSRHPVSDIIHIRGLVRPFLPATLKQEISSHGGEILDFWIDKVRSHCFVKLTSSDCSKKVINAMHGKHWPEANPKFLSVVYDSEENMNRYKTGDGETKLPEVVTIGSITRGDRLTSKKNIRVTVENALRDNNKRESELKEKKISLESRLTRSNDKTKESTTSDRKRQRSETPPFSRGAGFMNDKKTRVEVKEPTSRERKYEPEEVPLRTPDQLFPKTKFAPALYYKPLTDEQVAAKEKRRSSLSGKDRDRTAKRRD